MKKFVLYYFLPALLFHSLNAYAMDPAPQQDIDKGVLAKVLHNYRIERIGNLSTGGSRPQNEYSLVFLIGMELENEKDYHGNLDELLKNISLGNPVLSSKQQRSIEVIEEARAQTVRHWYHLERQLKNTEVGERTKLTSPGGTKGQPTLEYATKILSILEETKSRKQSAVDAYYKLLMMVLGEDYEKMVKEKSGQTKPINADDADLYISPKKSRSCTIL